MPASSHCSLHDHADAIMDELAADAQPMAALKRTAGDAGVEQAPRRAGRLESAIQQTITFTLPSSERLHRGAILPWPEARAAGLRGNYETRTVLVPELRREVTLGLGWRSSSYRLGFGWFALASDMGLSEDTPLVLTVAEGSICRIERAVPAAAVPLVAVTAAADLTACAAVDCPSESAPGAQPCVPDYGAIGKACKGDFVGCRPHGLPMFACLLSPEHV